VGSVLAFAGIEGFLANRETMRVELDDEEVAWQSFLAAWFGTFETDPVRVRDLLDAIRPTTNAQHEPRSTPLRDALPESLGDPDDRYLGVRLGTALRERRDRILGEFRLRRAGHSTHAKTSHWHVEQVSAAASAHSAGSPAAHTRASGYKSSTERESGRQDSPHSPHYPQSDREPGEDDGDDDPGECLG
jgi:hypothetical protein